MLRHLVPVLLIACHAQPAVATLRKEVTLPAAVTVATCRVVESASALVAAIASERCVYVAGTIDIDTPPSTLAKRRPYGMVIMRKGVRLTGDGVTSVLNFRGDAGRMDWHGVEVPVGGDDVTVEHLVLRTAQLTGTIEQTHVVWGTGPFRNLSIVGNTCDHPIRTNGDKSGDCFNVFGYPGAQMVHDVRIVGNTILHSSRSALGSHSGVDGMLFADNVSLDSRAQDVDTEGDDAGHANWVIVRNRFELPAQPAGPAAMQLAGITGAVVADNEFHGRGINMFRCNTCTLENNAITQSYPIAGDYGVIEGIKDSSHVLIHRGSVTRLSSAGPGPVIRIGPHGSLQPEDLRIEDVKLVQRASGNVITVEGIVGLQVTGNEMEFSGIPGLFRALSAGASPTVRTSKIVFGNNIITGPLQDAIVVSSSRAGTGSVIVYGNTVNGEVVHGLRCDAVAQGNKVIGPVATIIDGMPAGVCGAVGFIRDVQ